MDLKEMVLIIELLGSVKLQMTLRSEPGKTVRPFEVITNIFSLPEEQVKQAKDFCLLFHTLNGTFKAYSFNTFLNFIYYSLVIKVSHLGHFLGSSLRTSIST